jgi:TATA-box binding protein (TBP) (component of TFIID and TFIIIB)
MGIYNDLCETLSNDNHELYEENRKLKQYLENITVAYDLKTAINLAKIALGLSVPTEAHDYDPYKGELEQIVAESKNCTGTCKHCKEIK